MARLTLPRGRLRRDGNGAGQEERWSMPLRRSPSILDSFNFAFEGIIHVLRTQRNMRVHLAASIAVLVGAVWIGVSKLELIALLLAIAFVFIAEMINSALEQAIDVATTSFDPLAKLAKDIAAGAVLIATVNAIAIGYLVFSGEIADRSSRLLESLRDAPAQLTLIALVVTVIAVIAAKAYTGRGRPLRGGLPSGHAAVAFAGWMAATLVIGHSHRFLISSLTFIMALLVAQTRVEAGIHSALEVTYGGFLGAVVAASGYTSFASTGSPSATAPARSSRTRRPSYSRTRGSSTEPGTGRAAAPGREITESSRTGHTGVRNCRVCSP